MRLLLVGDLHYDMRQLDWIVGQAADHDLVVIAGDLLDLASSVPLEAQVPVVVRYLERLARRTATVVCSGNHDLTGRDVHGEKAAAWLAATAARGVVTDFGSLVVDGTLVTVCPFWDGPQGRARVDELLAAQSELVHDRWCWVYHWPPPDLPVSWTGSRSYGDADLGEWIERWHPDLVLTGHVHQAPVAEGGSWVAQHPVGSWILNAGRQVGPVPCHIVVDLDAPTADGTAAPIARWWSLHATDERQLVAPPGR